MEELIDLVLGLNEQIKNEIPEINHGGCGVFALIMAKQLELLGYNPTISILTNYFGDTEDKKRVLNEVMNGNKVNRSEKLGTSFAHCCIEVGGLIFDGKMVGVAFKEKWISYPITGSYSIEELSLALKIGSWNDDYSRKYNNPKLRRIIKNTIKKVFHVEHERLSFSL
jgi:hypothetical protein